MDADNILRRMRGAVGNALVWGAGWAGCAIAVFATMKIAGLLPASVIWLDAIVIAGRLGFVGAIAGGAFSIFIGLLYRGQRLSQINRVRFAVGGGMMAGLFVPAFLQTMNLLSGDGFVPMELVLDDGILAGMFGAVLAGGSLRLAQRAQTLLPGGSQDRPGLLGSGTPLASAEAWPAWMAHRSRSAQR